MIIIDFSFDADDGAFAAGPQGIEAGVVAKNGAAKGARTVAEIDAEKRVAVGGGLGGEFFYDQHRRKSAAAAGVHLFKFANRGEGKGVVSHEILQVECKF